MVSDAMNQEKIPEVERNPWVDNLFRPAILTAMVSCLSVAIIALVKTVNPSWRAAYFLTGMILVTVEAIYSYRVLKQYRSVHLAPWRFRLVEWGALILLLKLLTYSNKPWSFILADLQSLARSPLDFFSLELTVLLVLAAFAWGAATSAMQDFEALYDPFTFRSASITPFDDLMRRFFWGGGWLVLISGVTQWALRNGMESLIDLRRPSIGGVILNVMIYFMLGLILLSQAQLTMLLTRWKIQDVEVSSRLVKRWTLSGLALLAIVTLAVLFLPTGYSLGFLASIGVALQFLLEILFFLGQLLVLLLSLPFLLLGFLLPDMELGMGTPTPIQPPIQGGTQGLGSAGPPWWEALRSLAFWLILLAMAWYLIRTYLKDHPDLLEALKNFRLFRISFGWLTSWWQWLVGIAQAGVDLIPRSVKLSREGDEVVARTKWRWPRLRSMSAQEKILYYYLNTLERAAKAGSVRQKHQTPAEFETDLTDSKW